MPQVDVGLQLRSERLDRAVSARHFRCDVITVSGYLAKDGAFANARTITLSDGRTVFAGFVGNRIDSVARRSSITTTLGADRLPEV